MRKHTSKLVSFLAIILLVFLFLRWEHSSLLLQGDLEGLQETAGENLLAILPLTFLIMLIHNLFPVIPLIFVVSVNIAMLGFIPGYMWSLVSSALCASAAFIAARYWLQDLLAGRVSVKLMNKIEENGFWVVLIARIIPYMPTSIMNIAAAISTIRYKTFILSTIAGNAIFMFAVTLISLGVMTVDIEIAALALFLLATAGFAVSRWRARSKRQRGI